MAYANKYRIQFNDRAGRDIRIDIQEDGFAGSITTLKSGSVILEWAQFDKIKDFGIKQSRMRFSVLCDESLPPETFLTTSDTQYRVILYVNSVANWYGFLDNTDFSFPFRDDKYFIELFARDGLHLLSSAKLEISGSDPWFAYRVTDLFKYWFGLTGLELNYWTWINIYPDGTSARSVGSPANDPFYYTFVNYKTFQEDDPFTALNKIVTGFGCQLFQARGKWHIVYVEDWIRDLGLYGTEWDKDGNALGIAEAQRFNVTIGLREQTQFANADTVQNFQPASKGVRLNYTYEVPRLLRNQDLNEGDFLSYNTTTQAFYDPKHWTLSGSSAIDVKTLATLEIASDLDSEINRKLYFRTNSSVSHPAESRLTSTIIQCQAGDFFTFKFKQPLGSLYSVSYLVIKLISTVPIGDKYLGSDGKWKTSGQEIQLLYPENTFFNVDAIPSGGVALEIQFLVRITPAAGTVSGGTLLTNFYDIDFSYDAYVNENVTYRGQFNKIENTDVLRNYIEDSVFISDSPNVVFKGTITNSTSSILRYWYHNGITEKVRFSKLITYAYYKLHHRPFIVLESSILNTMSGTNNYLLSPLDTAFVNSFPDSEFLFCTLTLDIPNNQARATFNELHNGTDFAVTGDETFKLIDKTERRIVDAPEEVEKPIDPRFGAIGFLVQKFKRKKKR